jgi:hypothetical protein
MSNSETTLSNVLAWPDSEVALATTATIFGLAPATVIQIVEIALPLMLEMAAANPELRKRINASCGAVLPLPVADFYALMASNLEVRQSAMDDYRATYGNMLDSVNRTAARKAGVTDGQAREVVAALLPALGRALLLPEADGHVSVT